MTRFSFERDREIEAEEPGRWARFKEMIGLGRYEDEDEEEDQPDIGRRSQPQPQQRRGPALRLQQTSRAHQIVKISVQTIEDARRATDMLKERRPVVMNLERTEDDVARRAIDFISGATYALDGYYERVGEKVFLFTPSNVMIANEDEEALTAPRALYGDER